MRNNKPVRMPLSLVSTALWISTKEDIPLSAFSSKIRVLVCSHCEVARLAYVRTQSELGWLGALMLLATSSNITLASLIYSTLIVHETSYQ
ncbi:hypothetical protein GQ53DRAFT_741106 [Thozetella sp. PMI_491]|nr:hypothetical protein GQ53DRAFT_741106 [Thozetella sp. PMI_491]